MTLTALQRSFEDMGTPLHEVTFCVIDLETTGRSPDDAAITEIGAVKLRGGERTGTFHTMVNPQTGIPAAITALTGITSAMVADAPPISAVLPSLVEFISDSVIVGHNVSFDLGFMQAALTGTGRARLANRYVDTCSLARRLVRDEVPNCKLGTLSACLELDHRPSHRALDDALATGDLLHLLIERASGLGVTGLDDLITLPKMMGHPQAAKLALTTGLPRAPGVYIMRDRSGEAIYVGKATDLRSRVRSYFSGESRRKTTALLRETVKIDHIECANTLEAAVVEVRMIHELTPRHNSQLKDWSRRAYVKLTESGDATYLTVTRSAGADRCHHLGPLPSSKFAKTVIEALDSTIEGPEQLSSVFVDIVDRPGPVLGTLRSRMSDLAGMQNYEQAAQVRERASTLADAIQRQRHIDMLRRAGTMVFELLDGGGFELDGCRLVRCWPGGGAAQQNPLDATGNPLSAPVGPALAPLARESADEALCIARWIEANLDRIRLIEVEGTLATGTDPIDMFIPREHSKTSRSPAGTHHR